MKPLKIQIPFFAISAVILVLAISLLTNVQAAAKRDITIEDLVTIRDIDAIKLSPDGKYVAFQAVQRNMRAGAAYGTSMRSTCIQTNAMTGIRV